MEHCKKLGGRSASVRTEAEWRHLHEEAKEAIIPEDNRIWLSATEGDIEQHLGEPDHWPEGITAEEGVWRDYYTGDELENYSKPWISKKGDKVKNTTDNCIFFKSETGSWTEWQCKNSIGGFICPCHYETPPIINFRGLCPDTFVEHSGFVIRKRPTDQNMIMVGHQSAKINLENGSQWILRDTQIDTGHRRQMITAKTDASTMSYALGRNNWTISGDNQKCSEGKDYTIALKLSVCKEDEFTCNDGHCVKMEERCNQMSNCKDDSDEVGCKILVLKESYNKRVPPVTAVWSGNTVKPVKTMKEVAVVVSLTLHKIVAIHEEDHSIEFQFQIRLEWKENRAGYHNLKVDSYFNALSEDEIESIWLPLVIYTNTDQQESSRLGWVNEWSTNVRVKREGNFTRSGFEVLDETEVFKGQENSLIMTQSYTHEFQCIYELERYPFDTQV